jgi:glycosyltransferase involved in cell wall biosynthesis
MDSIEIPFVSVVINTRNRCRILPRAIESVLRQTYSNFELIIVDGASTDSTKDIAIGYLQKDKRIKYLYVAENLNGAHCLNLGFKLATGNYIAVLDDDDEFLPTKIEKQVRWMESSDRKIGILYCWDRVWDDKKNRLIRERKTTNKGNLYPKLLSGPCTGASSEMMIKKEAIEKVGGWDETISLGADYQFNLNVSEFFEHDVVPEILVITHWNHEYVHMTTQPGGKINYDAVIEYYQKILSDHQKGFDNQPSSRYWHYKGIISAALKSKQYSIVKKYFLAGIYANVALSSKIKFTHQVLRRIALSLLNL